MHCWCFAFVCLAVSVGYTAAAPPTAFTQSEEANVVVTVDLAVSGVTDVPLTLTLAENFGTGTITTISATGAAVGAVTWTSSNTDIAISDVGVVTATLDYEASDSMTATLSYLDGGTAVGTVALTLAVTDVNDVDPVFTPTSYAETVADGAAAGTTVTTVTGSDGDGPTFNTITYEISHGNTGTVFEVASNGDIKIASGKTVDRATLKAYGLEVLVKDAGAAGSTQQTGTTTVLIGVCSSAARAVATCLVVLLAVGIAILP